MDLPRAPAGDLSAADVQREGERRGLTVLVVEDERLLLQSLALGLRESGHDVLAAASPPEALRLLATRGPELDLVLSDVHLEGPAGRDLLEAVGARRIPVLFMSGLSREQNVEAGRVPPGCAFLEKPFSPDALLAAVDEVLARKRVPAEAPRRTTIGG